MAKRIREKAEVRRQNKDTRPCAKSKYERISPSKVRIVLDLVRGKQVDEAVAILANSPHKGAFLALKVLNSAIANAENNRGYSRTDLYVAETWVGAGPTLKRLNIRARGRADRKLSRTSHITFVLDSRE